MPHTAPPHAAPLVPRATPVCLRERHLLSVTDLDRFQAEDLIARAFAFLPFVENPVKKLDALRGRTIINLFFENSTRTQSSFELAGKRMSADVVNMAVRSSSVAKGETLIDTAITLNAMAPDVLIVRHSASGAAELLARKVECAVINAGDGSHEHPTQALLDAATILAERGSLEGLIVAICGDILHSRVARSNALLLTMLGARVRLIGPPTLAPESAGRWGAHVYHDMREGLKDADVVMMLRLQTERMQGGFIPSAREYFWFYGLDEDKLRLAKPGALVMHPGPMNRGVEIDSVIADDKSISRIERQVQMGVAVRMAVLEALTLARSAA
jgi:aspartate carbamoyltransferase catalytic subunit